MKARDATCLSFPRYFSAYPCPPLLAKAPSAHPDVLNSAPINHFVPMTWDVGREQVYLSPLSNTNQMISNLSTKFLATPIRVRPGTVKTNVLEVTRNGRALHPCSRMMKEMRCQWNSMILVSGVHAQLLTPELLNTTRWTYRHQRERILFQRTTALFTFSPSCWVVVASCRACLGCQL